MSRQYCTRCQRPLVTCICKLTCHIENQVNVWLLQHPSEEKQSKGTATLTHLSLKNSKIIVGEDFTENEELNTIIDDNEHQVYLLYPDDTAMVATKLNTATKVIVLVLDGTWKKAYKMYQLSKNLHSLPKLTLGEHITSNYVIRKHHKETDVSTLEACVHALSSLEGDTAKYQPLLESFQQFNEFQLSLSKQHRQPKNNKNKGH